MIENLELKLKGNIPITRNELFEIINSWGRKDSFFTFDDIIVKQCKKSYSYPLENLDVSQIDDLSSVFDSSLYNGDLSKWDVSNCKDMDRMFCLSNFNNNSLKNWNVSNVKNMNLLFYASKFNGDVSNWDISNCLFMNEIFFESNFNGDISKWNFNKNVNCNNFIVQNIKFINKYNDGNYLTNSTKDFLKWFEENREKMKELNQGTKKEVFDFFSFDNKNIEFGK